MKIPPSGSYGASHVPVHMPVSSSNIESVGYHEGRLQVRMTYGHTYQYENVPADVHQAMMKSDSVGSFIHEHLKNRYPFSVV